ncbi:MerR family transcriptional regulator [Propionibacterium freudenreichii]|uniref:MerR family transcriptional regulator n=1 Tax=Propionibacterium freudenreichii TaxID=1744 RepID=UPI00254FDE31|nr:MerR family transcriptional regulator [Propionibacterium freudenreichii]MDK9353822.1 MerR family transcriptional regulator [Propionibacterium freudenreichii]
MRISEVSQITGIPASTLRYYERRGILEPSRSDVGDRDYTDHDIAWIRAVQRLLDTGMPLAQVQEYSQLRHEGDSTVSVRLAMLQSHRGELEARRRRLDEQLAFLDDKIDVYRTKLASQSSH